MQTFHLLNMLSSEVLGLIPDGKTFSVGTQKADYQIIYILEVASVFAKYH